MKKIYIIDGNSLINRAFYALPLLANSNGVYSNAVFGFVNCLIKLITENKPDYLVVAFDHARQTFRNDIFKEYKGTRKSAPVELIPQFEILKKILKAMGITFIEQQGIEADDIIGTITKKSGIDNYIITGDRDCLQLINNSTKVWLTQKGITDIKEVNINNIKELYNLTPEQVIEFKALAGDSSDNIPGVAGIGEKTAINLLSEYGNIDNIYNNLNNLKGKLLEKISQGKEMCYMSKKLATIKTDCEIDFNLDLCTFNYPLSQQVYELFKEYNFNSLLKRENLFAQEKIEQAITINIVELENIINNYNQNYFAFKLTNDFEFNYCNKKYIIYRADLFIEENDFYDKIFNIIKPILQEENILKIVVDLKTIMHKFNFENICNVFDLTLGCYLLSGGNPLKTYDNCSEYYNEYLLQHQQLQQLNMLDLYYKVELPLEKVLFEMENQGFALDRQTLNNLELTYKDELKNLELSIKAYSSNENFNVKSPKQVADLLFNELKLPDKTNKKHSTNVEALESLKDMHPIVSLILRHRKVSKLYSTYIEPYIKMLSGKSDSIIHTIFNQTLTSTGRLSSSEPNLQNIPVRDDEGRLLRKMFISRFDGGKLISADYNQIELRLLANFSNDRKLINDYNKGTDIHRLTASHIFGIDPQFVTDKERRMAKAVNFGIIYGISSFGLAKNIDMPVKEAKQYIDLYFEKYPDVKSYLDNLIKSAKLLGYAKTLFNRIRYIPELASNNGLQRLFGERIAMNMPLQGSASDIIKIAMINVHNRIKNENIKSKLILQIHDELIVDTYPGEENLVTNILIEEMQNAYKFEVPLIVSVGIGNTWYECK